MASRKVNKVLLSLLLIAVFTISFILFSINSAPLTLINRFTPKGVTLDLHGTLKSGQINAVTMPYRNQLTTLPLQCNWQQTAWLTFSIECTQPLTATATVEFGLFGKITAHNVTAGGNLHDIEPWLNVLHIPQGLDGDYKLSIDTAVIDDMILQTLSLTADIKQLSYFNQDVLPHVNITTKQSSNPIIIDTTADGEVRLFLESEINNNTYLTKGEIKSKQLLHFKKFLNFLGKQTATDTWEIEMQGQLF